MVYLLIGIVCIPLIKNLGSLFFYYFKWQKHLEYVGTYSKEQYYFLHGTGSSIVKFVIGVGTYVKGKIMYFL